MRGWRGKLRRRRSRRIHQCKILKYGEVIDIDTKPISGCSSCLEKSPRAIPTSPTREYQTNLLKRANGMHVMTFGFNVYLARACVKATRSSMHFLYSRPYSYAPLLCHFRYPQRVVPTMSSDPSDSPWDPNYPIAKNQNPAALTRQNILDMLSAGQKPGVDFVLVDLRREDHIARSLRSSTLFNANTKSRGGRSKDPST